MLHTADYGQRRWFISTDGGSVLELSTEQFLRLPFCQPNDQLVFESAHGVPRTEGSLNISLAQALTRSQALQLLDAAEHLNVQIRCFPQGETPKWASTLNIEKSDKTDPIILHAAVNTVGFHSLQRYHTIVKQPVGDLELAGRIIKQELNGILNFTRGLKDLSVTPCTKLLNNNLEAIHNAVNTANPLAGELFFDIKTITRGPRTGTHYSITSAGVALWATVVDLQGQVRLHNNNPWGINSLMRHVLNFRPMHHRGGIARSNLWFHNFGKRYRRREFNSAQYIGQDKLKRDPDSIKITEMKRLYRRAVLDALRAMQSIAMTLQ